MKTRWLRPISELLALQYPPTCGALTDETDACMRRVKAEGDRCWQHR